MLKLFLREVSRSQLFSWKRKGLLKMDAEIEGKEVKPKFEKLIRYEGGGPRQPISKKQAEILEWVKEKEEISYSELTK